MAPLSAMFKSVERKRSNDLSSVLSSAFLQLANGLMFGNKFVTVVKEISIFQQPTLKKWRSLLKNAYANPEKAPVYWMQWMIENNKKLDWKKDQSLIFINEYLAKNGLLWIVGESKTSVDAVTKFLKTLVKKAKIKSFPGNSFETISLACKRGELIPSKSQLVLWVGATEKKTTILCGIDEIYMPNPGTCEYSFQNIMSLKSAGKLVPTGVVPSSYEKLKINKKIDISFWSPEKNL